MLGMLLDKVFVLSRLKQFICYYSVVLFWICVDMCRYVGVDICRYM